MVRCHNDLHENFKIKLLAYEKRRIIDSPIIPQTRRVGQVFLVQVKVQAH